MARAVTARWLLHVDWNLLLKEGWGALFGWLDRFGRPPEVVPDVEAELWRRQQRLSGVVAQAQVEARQIMSSLQALLGTGGPFHCCIYYMDMLYMLQRRSSPSWAWSWFAPCPPVDLWCVWIGVNAG